MHELSIALSIVDVASEEADRRGARVMAVHLRLGPLSGVVKEALLSSYGLACEDSPLAGSRLVIRETPIVAWCPSCQREQQIESAQSISCPACRAPTPDIRGGRELEVTALEIQDDLTQSDRPAPMRNPAPD